MGDIEATQELINSRDFESGIKLLDTIYAITMVLGFRELALGLYDLFFHKVSFYFGGSFIWLCIPLNLMALAIISFGLRFFWGVVNVRRYVDRMTADNLSIGRISTIVINIHVGVLLIQGFLFYFLGKIYTEIVEHMSLRQADSYVICSIILLAVNAVWLKILIRDHPETTPERLWIKNNTLFSIGCVLLMATCWWIDTKDCLTVEKRDYGVITGFSIIFLTNSLIDLYLTSGHYFGLQFFKEPEK